MTDDHTMTDTTKPTCDTIDMNPFYLIRNSDLKLIREVAERVAYDSNAIASDRREAQMVLDLMPTLRLAERPNRAVARGDETETVPTKLVWDAYQALGRHMEFWTAEDHDVADRLAALMTTPTETTDPAMECDDEQA